jgi:hypothetical protein
LIEASLKPDYATAAPQSQCSNHPEKEKEKEKKIAYFM